MTRKVFPVIKVLKAPIRFFCVSSGHIICVFIVIDLHPADKFSDQLQHGLRAQPANFQDSFMVYTFRVLVALYHLQRRQRNQLGSDTTKETAYCSNQFLSDYIPQYLQMFKKNIQSNNMQSYNCMMSVWRINTLFVIRERPKTLRPQWVATTTSGAVLIPENSRATRG